MSKAILFGGASSIDNELVRRSVIRIPEVSLRLRQAQEILDECLRARGESIDILNILSADDESFKNHLDYRGLLAFVIQVGLYDRYLRLAEESRFFISESNGQMAAEVCARSKTLAEVIEGLLQKEMDQPRNENAVPQLTKGVTNKGYAFYEMNEEDDTFQSTNLEIYDLGEALEIVNERYGIEELVIIGPGDTITEPISQHMVRDRMRMSESIELDPLLSWFWSDIRRAQVAIA